MNKDDFFQLKIEKDTTKYGVVMPEAFAALPNTDLEAFQKFEALTMGKKRSLIYFIDRFKSKQTPVDKALIICENLKWGMTDLKNLVKQLR